MIYFYNTLCSRYGGYYAQKQKVQHSGCAHWTFPRGPQSAVSCVSDSCRNAQISKGIAPVKSLKWRNRFSKLTSIPSSDGIGPRKSLSKKFNVSSLSSEPKRVGMVLLILFDCTDNARKFMLLTTSVGIEPLKSFAFASRNSEYG